MSDTSSTINVILNLTIYNWLAQIQSQKIDFYQILALKLWLLDMLEQAIKWSVLNGKHLALCYFHKGPTLPLLQVL